MKVFLTLKLHSAKCNRMETDRSKICGCKGLRSCLKCEKLFNISPKIQADLSVIEDAYVYCNKCDNCWQGWNSIEHEKHIGKNTHIGGIHVTEDFLSEQEENQLIEDLDLLRWDLSQSGRRKQNFGPKCNFKKKKLRLGDFKGFPVCTKFIHDKFRNVNILNNFFTVEQCTLEYDPKRGASIDPHIDDCWIWGERIVTVNLLTDTILTLTPYRSDSKRYNHDLAPVVFKEGSSCYVPAIRIPMPRRSLIVLTGEARYSWLHQIFREDIHSRRVCLAFREFSSPYLPGGEYSEEGKDILELGNIFLQL